MATAAAPPTVPRRSRRAAGRTSCIRTYRSISEDRVLALAAGVTYYVLLAVFPGHRGPGLDLRPRRRSGRHRRNAGEPRRHHPARRDRHHQRPAAIPRLAGREGPGPCLLRRPAGLAVELQRRDEGAVRRAQCRLWREGEAQFLQADGPVARLHRRHDPVHGAGADRHRGDPGGARLPASRRDGRARHQRPALAGDAGDRGAGPGGDLSLWPVPRRCEMALDHLGQRRRRVAVVHRVDAVLAGTPATSATTTRPMARSARSSPS